jgi:AraC family transcriptional activator of pobA
MTGLVDADLRARRRCRAATARAAGRPGPAINCADDEPDLAQCDTVSVLFGEYAQHAPWRATAVDAAMTQLFVTLARALPSAQAREPGVGDRSVAHVQRLRTLVDERFRQQPTLGQLADEIGITTTQLNRVCRAVLGHPALAVLHARICLEAQRELAYTTLSIKHIAYKLGFTDAGYFTRFFERETGSTPSAWRAEALTRQ